MVPVLNLIWRIAINFGNLINELMTIMKIGICGV